jgi:myo-inositol-1(or 4)-monophosphatase
MDKIIEYATRLAKNIGTQTLQNFQIGGVPTKLKSDRTVVTEADLAADRYIRASIQEDFPDDGIISEEHNTVFPDNKTYVWIIDPLDGTTNFSLGMHYWGVSIARLRNGIPDLGVLYFPVLDELFTASLDGGAFLNSSPLHVKNPETKQPNTFFSSCSRSHRYYQIDLNYKIRVLGSAAYGLCTVPRGSAILAFEVTPKVWDFSASWLVVREAGGVISPLDGVSPFPLIPGTNYGSINYPMLAAVTRAKWDQARKKIQKK